jgi:ADP-heptose:LPS heptosyltransferase
MNSSPNNSTKILIYQLGSLGDTVVTLPAFKAIRRHFGSQANITLLHEIHRNSITRPSEVLDGLGLVDAFVRYRLFKHPVQQWLYMGTLAMKLRAMDFGIAIYLAPSERSEVRVKRDAAFFYLSGIKHRIGFCSFSSQMVHPVDTDGLPSFVQHEAWFRLERLRRDGIDVSAESDLTKPFLSLPIKFVKEARQWLSGHRENSLLPLVAICPGCKQPANVWPVERFIEIGKRLVKQGTAEIMVVGGPEEREIGRKMVELWGRGLNAAGVFPPLGSAALLGECDFVIGLDTGTTHLAAAQGVPCVALYGCREEPGRFYPLGEKHIVLRHSVPCAGCRLILKRCPLVEHPCMNGITVDQVWNAIHAIERSLLDFPLRGQRVR